MTTHPEPGTRDDGPHGLRGTLADDPLGLAAHRRWDGEAAALPGPARGDRRALARLVAVVAAVLVASYAAGVGETVLLVLALILCIVLHELGHFLTAKAARMKVTAFFVGFGPTLWSVRRGETEYGVKGIPLGGFCRIIGMHNLEDVDPADEARTYRQKPMWRRLSVALAGSAMHFLIAIVVLFAMFFWTGDDSGYLAVPASSPISAIDGLTSGQSPAQQAGFRLGDRIEAVDGHHFATFDALTAYVRARPDRRLVVTVERDGHTLTLDPTTANLAEVVVTGAGTGTARPKHPTGFIGIELSSVVHSGVGASISAAGGDWVHSAALTLDALGRLVTLHGISAYLHNLTSQKAADSPTNKVRFESPVGVVRLFHTAAADGLATVLYLLALVNLSLGLFNLVPMLPLDGGHVVIALYEGARSRHRRYHADVGKLLPLFYLVIVVLVFLGASSLFLDLRDLVT
jgi:membrane-associated protease RseP (regulator of RpoE activity)